MSKSAFRACEGPPIHSSSPTGSRTPSRSKQETARGTLHLAEATARTVRNRGWLDGNGRIFRGSPRPGDHPQRAHAHGDPRRAAGRAARLLRPGLRAVPQRPHARFLTPGVFFYILAVIALLLCYELGIRLPDRPLVTPGKGRAGRAPVPERVRRNERSQHPDHPRVARNQSSLRAAEPAGPSLRRLHRALHAAAGLQVVRIHRPGRGGGVRGPVVRLHRRGERRVGGAARAAASTPFEAPPFYVAKGAMLLLAGLAAGFVATS